MSFVAAGDLPYWFRLEFSRMSTFLDAFASSSP